MARPRSTTPSLSALCRPLPLLALGLLLLNDHWLKGSGLLSGAITGKLSDVAGLFLLPILLSAAGCAALELWRGPCSHRLARRLSAVAAVAPALAFTALQMWPAFNQALEGVWGVNVMDPSDLYALPMVGLAWWWFQRWHGRATREPTADAPVRVMVAAVAVLACVATPAPRQPRHFPMWQVDNAPREFSCARIAPVVSKSGKTGAGLTLVVRGLGPGTCRVQVESATMSFVAPQGISPATSPATSPTVAPAVPMTGEHATEVADGQLTRLYLPFVFDNNELWNRQVHRGQFALELVVNGRAQPAWQLPASQARAGYHHNLWERNSPTSPAPASIAQ